MAAGGSEGGVLLVLSLCIASEVTVRTGVQAQGYGYSGGRRAQPFYALGGDGTYRVSNTGTFADRLLIEGGLLGQLPLTPGGAFFGAAAVARVGLVFGDFWFTVGANMRLDATPSPFLVLPALTLGYKPGVWGVRGGFFDQAGGPLAHVALEYKDFGLGYVAPVGAEVYGRIPLSTHTAFDARFYGYSAGTAFAISLLVGVVFGDWVNK